MLILLAQYDIAPVHHPIGDAIFWFLVASCALIGALELFFNGFWWEDSRRPKLPVRGDD